MATRPIDPWLLARRREIGTRLRNLREWRNLSQEDLGHEAGLSRDSVIRYEAGSRAMRIDEIHLLTRALNVPPAWLLNDDPLPSDEDGEPSAATAG